MLPVVIAVTGLSLAAAVAFAVAVVISGWPPIEGADGPAYAVPGSPGASVEARLVPLLFSLGGGALGLAVALGLTAWIFRRGLAAGYRGAAGAAPVLPAGRRRLRFAVMGPALLVAVLGTFGLRWYAYVTNTDSPYDEVGIGLNARVPEPLRAWGCGRLKATFGDRAVPPLGCGAEGVPGRWR